MSTKTTAAERRRLRMERIKARAAKGQEALSNSLLTNNISELSKPNEATPTPTNQTPQGAPQISQTSQNTLKGNIEKIVEMTKTGGDEARDEDERELLKQDFSENPKIPKEEDVFTRYKKLRQKEKKRVNFWSKNRVPTSR